MENSPVTLEKDELIESIRYGKYDSNNAMCYPTIITNKQTYGPYGKDMSDSTVGLQIASQCNHQVSG